MKGRQQSVCALAILSLVVIACSMGKQNSTSTNSSNQSNQSAQSSQSNESTSQIGGASPQPTSQPGALNPGEASGSFTVKGETIPLKFAYAARARRFNSDSIVVLVTEKPIPAEALAEEINSQTLLLDEKIRGLEYVFEKDGHWVRYHPSQFQESDTRGIKEYIVENGIVRGYDDENASDGKYARSVRFVAALKKE